MAKKQVGVSLRKPPPPADLDAYVSDGGGGATLPVHRAEMDVATESGRPLREMTIYLPVDLARQLALHCTERDRDLSNVIGEAMAKHLEPAARPAPKPEPRAPWTAWLNTLTLVRTRLWGA